MSTPSIPTGAIVVGVVGSDLSDRALAWATEVAVRENRPLVLAHGVTPVSAWVGGSVLDIQALNLELSRAGEDLVARARARAEVHLAPEQVIGICLSEDARHLLADLSRHAHLLVLGSRGNGRLRSMVLGSVSSAVVRTSQCPVVVVRDASGPHAGGGVVVGVDGTEGSTSVLEFAFRAASWQREGLTVAHCFWDEASSDGQALTAPPHSDFAAERLVVSEAIAGLREKYPDVDVTVEIDRGLAEHVLADLSAGASLVVVGYHPHAALTDFVFGSVARALVERAHCPVAVIRLGHQS